MSGNTPCGLPWTNEHRDSGISFGSGHGERANARFM